MRNSTQRLGGNGRMGRIGKFAGVASAVLACLAISACGGKKEEQPKKAANKASGTPEKLVIGVIAKSKDNKIFIPVEKGAIDAAKALSAEHGVDIQIRWRTPDVEDAKRQAEELTSLANEADGIAISVSDSNVLTSAIDDAVAKGIPVVTFDSDAPDSGRFAYYGTDNYDAGMQIMRELAQLTNGQGTVAILSGNQNATNLNARVQGALDELKKHPGMTLQKVYYQNPEGSKQAVETIETAQAAFPDITGWVMVGGWALYTDNALDKIKGKARVVSLDAMPPQLPYVERGEAEVLLGQNSYDWGYRSVELLVENILNNEKPADPAVKAPLTRVTKDNVAEHRNTLKSWGLD